ncbi:phaC PHA synthase [Vibrio sp. 10N.286.49.B3]|uniref:VC2662 family protein n=1 Tax=Vibrio sp. 10N.286.49.B3 TaxID=1880855 RepID=UPI000C85728C|nr:phaC PHA synthase [Vibrio sp. 10N.286.49.B3]PMH42137.1 phaC PHA synthase [Vibrio sp. 10N.286.49.B3]
MKKLLSVLAVTATMASPLALAASAPVMFSSIDNFNAPNNSSVAGLRVSALHGQVSEVKGVDLSLIGLSETDRTTGVNFGLFLGASKVNQEMKGASLGLLNWNTGLTTGVNFGAVNLTNDVNGLNWSMVNYSEGYTMADVGVVSFSEKSNFQFGLFNKTSHIDGVQIGLINCADNGFFKCFPLVNFAK